MTYTSIARRALVALALLTFALAVCAPAVPAGQTSSQIPSGQEVARELPPPDPSKAATRFAKVVGWPKGTMPQPAQGFSVALFADGLSSARWPYTGRRSTCGPTRSRATGRST